LIGLSIIVDMPIIISFWRNINPSQGLYSSILAAETPKKQLIGLSNHAWQISKYFWKFEQPFYIQKRWL
jgi:hypothetical protein